MKIYSHNVFDFDSCRLVSAREREYVGDILALKGGRSPPPPDPAQLSDLQTQSNKDTAAYNNATSHGNTTTPLGSQTYTGHVDPKTGAMVYDQNITLAPDQQKLLDMQNAQALHLGHTAGGLLDQVDKNAALPGLKSSYSWDDLTKARGEVQDALYRRQAQYLDPQYKQGAESLDSQLANSGITIGSDAWKAAKQNFGMDRSRDYGNARDSAVIGSSGEMGSLTDTAHKQLVDAMAIRDRPLNEYTALKSGSQVNMPQFNNATNAPTANTDVAGNYWNAYNGKLNAWNAGQQSSNGIMQGLIGAGGNMGAAAIGK